MKKVILIGLIVLMATSLMAQQKAEKHRGRYEVWNEGRVFLYSKGTGSGLVVQSRSNTDNWTFDNGDTLLSTVMKTTPAIGWQGSLTTDSDSAVCIIEILCATGFERNEEDVPDSQFIPTGWIGTNAGGHMYYSSFVDDATPDSVTATGWKNPISLPLPVSSLWRIRVRAITTSEKVGTLTLKQRRTSYIAN
ncbi:hypothetical protein LCGC14_0351400 [marine sediment metagenome]|uniref:Uncharacterized protein n=1 Tax=marine sediment metagenome TaxID=412755 RepID=A0A0F9VXY4_9ZZZZ